LISQRNALVAVARLLKQQPAAAPIEAILRMLVKVLDLVGAMAYRMEDGELVLCAEHEVPPKARAWLARLKLDDEPWFVAQRVALTGQAETDMELAASRGGVSLRPTLEAAGWSSVMAAPMALTGTVHGVLVCAAGPKLTMLTETVAMVEAVGILLGLALEREALLPRREAEPLSEEEALAMATGAPAKERAGLDLDEEIDIRQTRPEPIDVQQIRMLLARHKAADGDEEEDEEKEP
jgi:hypothetical protein